MRVLCFGDSNTYGYDPRSRLGGRYPAESRWVDLLAQKTGWQVQNAGENGREIPRRPQELQRFGQLLSKALPVDMLVVMLGTNDLLQGADAPTAAARMEAFLTQIPFSRGNVLLLAPPPMKPGTWVTEPRLLSDSVRLAEEYRALAERLGVRFADAGCWNMELTFDGVHFTEAGHKAFAEGLCRLLMPGD
ncbi:MAG: GDSL-type esterase/lipase family protein [Oscillospiraceae bacterium]